VKSRQPNNYVSELVLLVLAQSSTEKVVSCRLLRAMALLDLLAACGNKKTAFVS
jgi:hypothetical protein